MEEDKAQTYDSSYHYGSINGGDIMDIKQLLGAVGAMLFRIVFWAATIIVVFKLAVWGYDFGFNLFALEAAFAPAAPPPITIIFFMVNLFY